MDDRSQTNTDSFETQTGGVSLLKEGRDGTETIDIDAIFGAAEAEEAGEQQRSIADTSVGKLLQAIPIPAILISASGEIIFANTFCSQISADYQRITGKQFSSLFAEEAITRRVNALLEKVVSERKPQIAEGALKVNRGKIWGRLHFRSFKMGPERSVLVLIEHLAISKQQLRLNKKLRDRLARAADRPDTRADTQTVVFTAPDEPLEPTTSQDIRPEDIPLENAHLLTDLLTAAPLAMAYFEDGKLRWMNKKMKATFDHGQAGLIGSELRKLYTSPEEYHRARETLLNGLERSSIAEAEAEFQRGDGSTFTGRVTIAPIEPADPRRGTFTIIDEISSRREADAGAAKSRWSAQTSTAHRQVDGDALNYRRLMEGAPLGIVLCDTEGKVIDLNPVSIKMLGATAEADARNMNLLTYPHLIESGFSSVVDKCLKKGKPVVSEFPSKLSMGKQVFLRLNVAPVRDAHGEIVGAHAFIEDISEQKRSERLLLQSERLKAVGEMSGGVAHNFNNIMQFIAGGSRRALGFLESKEFGQMRPLLEQIFDQGRRGVMTIRRLQLFSRARRSMGVSRFSEAQMDVFDIGETVRDAVDKSSIYPKDSFATRGVDIAVDLDIGEGCFVEGEEQEMIEVIVHLLNNAVEALPVGGKIKVKTAMRDEKVILRVRDNGVGIPEKNIGRVFEPFWSTKEAHAGMGLTVCFGIVRRHKGTITLESRKLHGTTFTVTLPYATKPAHKEKPLPTQISERTYRILLCDDDEPIVTIFEKGLKKLGHTPIPTYSGQEALRAFREHEVDAIVCDLAMPGMNGWEVARAIHETCLERGVPKPPFIMLTGWAGQLADDEILSHPDVDVILEKPLKVPALIETVAREVRGAGTESTFSGRVDGIDLLEYVQLVMLTGKPTVVEVRLKKGLRGLLYMKKGQVRHAVCGDLEGEEAVYRCLNYEGGSFTNLPWREPEKISIDKPGEFLLIEAARRRDEQKKKARSGTSKRRPDQV